MLITGLLFLRSMGPRFVFMASQAHRFYFYLLSLNSNRLPPVPWDSFTIRPRLSWNLGSFCLSVLGLQLQMCAAVPRSPFSPFTVWFVRLLWGRGPHRSHGVHVAVEGKLFGCCFWPFTLLLKASFNATGWTEEAWVWSQRLITQQTLLWKNKAWFTGAGASCDQQETLNSLNT